MRSKYIAPALAIAAMAVAGCGGNDYPDKVEKQLISACSAGSASKSKCECELDALKKEVSYDEYKKALSGKASSEIRDKLKKAEANAKDDC